MYGSPLCRVLLWALIYSWTLLAYICSLYVALRVVAPTLFLDELKFDELTEVADNEMTALMEELSPHILKPEEVPKKWVLVCLSNLFVQHDNIYTKCHVFIHSLRICHRRLGWMTCMNTNISAMCPTCRYLACFGELYWSEEIDAYPRSSTSNSRSPTASELRVTNPEARCGYPCSPITTFRPSLLSLNI